MKPAPAPQLAAVADFRSGRSHCILCSSNGSLGVHPAVKDPAWELMHCHACGGSFWMSRADFERMMYAGPLVLPGSESSRLVVPR